MTGDQRLLATDYCLLTTVYPFPKCAYRAAEVDGGSLLAKRERQVETWRFVELTMRLPGFSDTRGVTCCGKRPERSNITLFFALLGSALNSAFLFLLFATLVDLFGLKA